MTGSPVPRVLVVIPARGGSKGIPRKNLRGLAGRPLIHYGINTALGSRFQPVVYVTSDDEEILSIAAGLGAKTLRRGDALAGDDATLDPVVHDACVRAEAAEGVSFDLVVTLQPTSPLLRTASLDEALARMLEDPAIDTTISARSDAHLSWTRRDGRYVPNYEARVNRQYLPPQYRETGGFLASRRRAVTPSGRIGARVELHLLSGGEEIDIDSLDDWALCEFHLRRRRLLFVVTGNAQVGLGHVHNSLLVANDILDHDVEFLVDERSEMAAVEIEARNYTVHRQQSKDLVDDVLANGATVVVNDCLDTTADYVGRLKAAGRLVINFEDLGPGAALADLVINAIYPESDTSLPRHYFGHRYMVLRDEFFLSRPRDLPAQVQRVLLTFGGVDPNNLTRKVLAAIQPACRARGIALEVVTGFGYSAFDTLASFEGVEVVRNTRNIARFMAGADLVFTSAGRTTYEVASQGVPCIVLAQNAREMTHLFANADNGFLHLGLGAGIDEAGILQAFLGLLDSPGQRQAMAARMRAADLRSGRERVGLLIRRTLATLGAAARD